MRWLGLLALWGLGGWIGLRLAQRESVDPASWGLIALWAALAVAVVVLLVRGGRAAEARRDPGEPDG